MVIKMQKIPSFMKEQNLYKVNLDFTGKREMTDCHEKVEFHNNSTLRIWYNDISVNYDMHWHHAMEIIIPVENHYDVTINQQNFHLQPEEILFIPPRELHSIQAPERGARFVYLFDISFLSKLNGYAGIMSMLTHPLYITKESYPALYREILQSFEVMKNDYFMNQEYSDFMVYSHFLKLCAILGQHHIQQLSLPDSSQTGKKREYVAKFLSIIEYIDAHYAENLSLEMIADASGFSKYHFSRLFKQYTGFTFCDYLNYRRIKQAEELLTKQDYSITEVAIRSGFTSISTFNRLFKQLKGCSPSEYRSKNDFEL